MSRQRKGQIQCDEDVRRKPPERGVDKGVGDWARRLNPLSKGVSLATKRETGNPRGHGENKGGTGWLGGFSLRAGSSRRKSRNQAVVCGLV